MFLYQNALVGRTSRALPCNVTAARRGQPPQAARLQIELCRQNYVDRGSTSVPSATDQTDGAPEISPVCAETRRNKPGGTHQQQQRWGAQTQTRDRRHVRVRHGRRATEVVLMYSAAATTHPHIDTTASKWEGWKSCRKSEVWLVMSTPTSCITAWRAGPIGSTRIAPPRGLTQTTKQMVGMKGGVDVRGWMEDGS